MWRESCRYNGRFCWVCLAIDAAILLAIVMAVFGVVEMVTR